MLPTELGKIKVPQVQKAPDEALVRLPNIACFGLLCVLLGFPALAWF